jgi:lysophospholipase L1-like esterase
MQLDQIVRIPLLPLLAFQGLAVRRRAQLLPEPPGPRSGQDGQGPHLRLLIAGDSSAAGVGAPTQDMALRGSIVARLSHTALITWRVEARTGDTTKDTVTRLESLDRQNFDVAVLALGVNDVTRATSQSLFESRQRELFRLLAEKFQVALILSSGVPPMGQFPLLPQPLRWVLGQHAARLDRVLARLSQELPQVVHVPMHLPKDPALAASDGFHPSPLAYGLWADMLVAQMGGKL